MPILVGGEPVQVGPVPVPRGGRVRPLRLRVRRPLGLRQRRRRGRLRRPEGPLRGVREEGRYEAGCALRRAVARHVGRGLRHALLGEVETIPCRNNQFHSEMCARSCNHLE